MSGEVYKVKQIRSDGQTRKLKINATPKGLMSEGRRLTRWENIHQVIVGKKAPGFESNQREPRYCFSLLSKMGKNFNFECHYASDRTFLLQDVLRCFPVNKVNKEHIKTLDSMYDRPDETETFDIKHEQLGQAQL